jgi:hypothetical protein
MITPPEATPVTIPVAAPTVAMLVLELLQAGLVAVSVNAVVPPTQVLKFPDIGPGAVFALTVVVTIQLKPDIETV